MPEALRNLIRVLARLPGVGRRSAERMAYRLLLRNHDLLRELRAALEQADAEITVCTRCGNLTQRSQNPCGICTDPRRDPRFLCIVEAAPDIQILEQARSFSGHYFCLQGKISPLQQETVSRPILAALDQRLDQDQVTEVLIALNSDVESDATASMIAEHLAPRNLRITRLAFGIPAGSGLAYSDPETLSRALIGRQPLHAPPPQNSQN